MDLEFPSYQYGRVKNDRFWGTITDPETHDGISVCYDLKNRKILKHLNAPATRLFEFVSEDVLLAYLVGPTLVAHSSKTGDEIWRNASQKEYETCGLSVVKNNVFFHRGDVILLCIDLLSGDVKWEKTFNGFHVITTPGLIWASEFVDPKLRKKVQLTARSQKTGDIVWQSKEMALRSIVAAVGGYIIVDTGKVIQCYRGDNLDDGIKRKVLKHKLKKAQKRVDYNDRVVQLSLPPVVIPIPWFRAQQRIPATHLRDPSSILLLPEESLVLTNCRHPFSENALPMFH